MNLDYLIIVSMSVLTVITMMLVLTGFDEIPYWSFLQEIKQQESKDKCDVTCKEFQENKHDYMCVQLDSDEYICRPPRDIFYPDEDIQVRTVFPFTYGEFAYIPVSRDLEKKIRIFDISSVVISDFNSKEILVEFEHHLRNEAKNYFEYSSILYPGDTFVSHCFGNDSKMGHVVEYRDIITINGHVYVEFWGTHVDIPDELLPCQMPELIEQSLLIDLGLGINFGEKEHEK